MEEKILLQRKFYAMKRRALERGEQWEMTVDDFIEWGTNKNIVSPTAKPVHRIDTREPWATGNLKIIETNQYFYHRQRRDVVLEVTPTTTLTKAQWVAELRAANGASDAK